MVVIRPFSFPMAHVVLFVFVASAIFHLQQRLARLQPPGEVQTPALQSARERPTAQQLQGMWTINAVGRLGNQMGQYATLYALAKLNGRPAYVPAQMHSTLAPIFRITLPVLPSTFVGVHVRRGDYVRVMPQVWKGVLADRGYLEQAMQRFRERFRSPVFVVTSNGMAWCRQNINASRGDVVFAGNGIEGSPAKDFALLTQCNHTIMTIGTFGIWAAYLAGGETIYLANYTLPDSPFLKVFKPEAAFLPEWTGIAADLSPLLKH
uniref:L-Fucosyltransferase n=1 Tax=Marmota marmota marmota TaxID=9994 RepID=A0A8C5ZCC2_MARMA